MSSSERAAKGAGFVDFSLARGQKLRASWRHRSLRRGRDHHGAAVALLNTSLRMVPRTFELPLLVGMMFGAETERQASRPPKLPARPVRARFHAGARYNPLRVHMTPRTKENRMLSATTFDGLAGLVIVGGLLVGVISCGANTDSTDIGVERV